MKPNHRLDRIILGALVAGGLAFTAGCGGGQTGGADGQLSGAVRVDGSSTVYPITEAVAEEFLREQPGVRVNVGVSGTGGGFAKFIRGEIDIANASRPIKDGEVAEAEAAGIDFIELPVAYDGLAVMVNPQNDWVDCLTTEELERIWGPGSQVDNWNQIRPSFPDLALALYGAGTDSGTYDYFTEAIGGASGASRTDFSASEDDNVLVQGIAGDRGSLGFFGYAYYQENQDKLKLLDVDDGDPANGEGCVQPTDETVRTGTYQPLSRPIFIYVNAAQATDPAVQAFVEYYLSIAPEIVPDVGYVRLTDREYDLSLQRFRTGTTGSILEGGHSVGVTLEDLLGRMEGAAGADTSNADTTGAAADTTAM